MNAPSSDSARDAELGLVVVVAKDSGAIGRDNQLLWHIKEDLRHFKRTTRGHAVVMGRKTFESIGKPLPGRHNIVLSTTMPNPVDEAFRDQVTVVRTVDEALRVARQERPDARGMPFVIGGAAVYEALLPRVTHIVLTEVARPAEGADAFFVLPESEFAEVRRAAAETEGVTFRWLERRPAQSEADAAAKVSNV